MDPNHWDNRYTSPGYVYGKSPASFFSSFLGTVKPGKILLPCEGEGRNAVYAASLGWEVYAFDQSEQGRQKALALARERQVTIHFDLSDVLDFNPGNLRFDLIAFIWAHFTPEVRKAAHTIYPGYLRQGGFFLIEGFSKKQLSFTSGGPRNAEMLLDVIDIREELCGLTTLQLEESLVTLEEGDFHRGEAAVIRYLGRKSDTMT
ncbi:MAG TPA: class I SAM-dependent methyltransferase [Bacteroidales bacterium]|nr:class I SAM-dependent methyltransferase [Bacteroidales bacterium]HSA43287.1 class I SAM-dependent methyltransferase [Bacteroidales bacterium]